jgi:serine carboxypeptidase-like clade 4
LYRYAREDDYICNWLGNRRWVRAMQWSGQGAFNATMPVPFVVDGVTGGDVIEAGRLSFVKMSESGHMAGDRPPGPIKTSEVLSL